MYVHFHALRSGAIFPRIPTPQHRGSCWDKGYKDSGFRTLSNPLTLTPKPLNAKP